MAGKLAVALDREMLQNKGVLIADAKIDDNALIACRPGLTGSTVFDELGGRYLIRYLMQSQVDQFRNGSRELHFVTPTPFTAREARSYLALPFTTQEREYYMLLDPREVENDGRTIAGPRFVRLGEGVEYLLPDGFPKSAIVGPGPIAITELTVGG